MQSTSDVHQPATAENGDDKSSRPRIEWVDCAKGLAIFLVVLGHVLGGGIYRKWYDAAPGVKACYDFIYLFHMPLFFLLSGLIAFDSLRTRPSKALASGLRGLGWPYLLWATAHRLAMPIFAKFVWAPSGEGVVEWFIRLLTGQYFWFLWTLLVMQILLVPLACLPLGGLFSLSLALYWWNALAHPFGVLEPVIRHLPFFLTGAALADRLLNLRPDFDTRARWWLGWSALGLLAVLGGIRQLSPLSADAMFLIGGWLGSGAAICLVLIIPAGRFRSGLRALGLASLAIYILHPYFQGAAREVLLRLLGMHPLVLTIAVTTIAVSGPMVIAALAKKWRLQWIFQLPKPRTPRAA